MDDRQPSTSVRSVPQQLKLAYPDPVPWDKRSHCKEKAGCCTGGALLATTRGTYAQQWRHRGSKKKKQSQKNKQTKKDAWITEQKSKMGQKHLKRRFSKEDIPVSNKHVKRWLTSLIIRGCSVTQVCMTLETLLTIARQTPWSTGLLQVRILGVGSYFLLPGGFSNPGVSSSCQGILSLSH